MYVLLLLKKFRSRKENRYKLIHVRIKNLYSACEMEAVGLNTLKGSLVLL